MSHLRVQTELPPSGILRIELFLFCSPVLCPGDKGRNQLWSRPMLLWEQCLLLLGGLSQHSFPRQSSLLQEARPRQEVGHRGRVTD